MHCQKQNKKKGARNERVCAVSCNLRYHSLHTDAAPAMVAAMAAAVVGMEGKEGAQGTRGADPFHGTQGTEGLDGLLFFFEIMTSKIHQAATATGRAVLPMDEKEKEKFRGKRRDNAYVFTDTLLVH